jgi:hypothetical protein
MTTETSGGASEPAYLTIKECAADVSVSAWAVWKACRLGYLPSIRVGTKPNSGVYRIPREAWEKWKAARAWRPVQPIVIDAAAGPPLIDQIMARRARGAHSTDA